METRTRNHQGKKEKYRPARREYVDQAFPRRGNHAYYDFRRSCLLSILLVDHAYYDFTHSVYDGIYNLLKITYY